MKRRRRQFHLVCIILTFIIFTNNNIPGVLSAENTITSLISKATNSKRKRGKAKLNISSPSDVGLIHYTVIDNLKYSFEKNLPKHQDDFLNALIQEMHESLCDEEDYKCEVSIYKQTLKTRSFIEDLRQYPDESEAIHDILPHDFDSTVKEHLLDSIASISLIKKRDFAYVMNALNAGLDKLKMTDSVHNEHHRQIGMMAIHVGMESLKQWVEIANDPEHIFYKVPYGKSHGFSSSSDNDAKRRRLDEWSRDRDDDDFTRREREKDSEDSEDESKSADTNVGQQQPQGFSFFSFIITIVIRDVIGVVGGAVGSALTGAPDQAPIGGAIAAIISSFIGFFVALGDTRTRVCIGPFTAGCVDVILDDDDGRETESESLDFSLDRDDDPYRDDDDEIVFDDDSGSSFYRDDDFVIVVDDDGFDDHLPL